MPMNLGADYLMRSIDWQLVMLSVCMQRVTTGQFHCSTSYSQFQI